MREQHALDLHGKDALATAADHLLAAADDREEPFGVECAQITREHPAVAHRARRLVRVPPVTAHGELAADGDLADGARGHVDPRLVEEPYVHVEVGPADRL